MQDVAKLAVMFGGMPGAAFRALTYPVFLFMFN